MRYIIFGLTLLTCFSYAHCQINSGIGFSSNVGLLQYEDEQQFDQSTLQRQISHNPGIHFFLESAHSDHFDYRLNAHLNRKTIQHANSMSNSSQELKQTLAYHYLSADIGMSVSYAAHQNVKWHPRLGLVFSINQLSDVVHTSTGSGAVPFLDLPSVFEQNDDTFFHIFIQTGVSFYPSLTIWNRQLELFLNSYLSPVDFLPNPIDFNNVVVQGKYHFTSLGINLRFNKTKNN